MFEIEEARKYCKEGAFREAEILYLRAAEKNAEGRNELVKFYLETERPRKALKWTDSLENSILSAKVHLALGNPEKALLCCYGALKNKTNLLDVGILFEQLGNNDAAIDAYTTLLSENPMHVDAWQHKGILSQKLGNLQTAEYCLLQALKINPEDPLILYNLGNLSQSLFQEKDAVNYYERSLQENPFDGNCYHNLAMALKALSRFEEALICFDKALELDPYHHLAYMGKAALLLLKGDFKKGWELFERRVFDKNQSFPFLTGILWSLDEIKGKSVFVFPEKGYGDVLQFLRYLPLIAETASSVIFRPYSGMETLIQRNFPQILVTPHEDTVLSRHGQYRIPIMSLGKLFGTIPFKEGYLKADPEKFKTFFPKNTYKVGIVWQGNPKHFNDHYRSIPFEILYSALRDIPGITLYALQKGYGAEQNSIINLGVHLNTFDDTASALHHLDLLISVDTSIVHLAGALGKQTWLLLPRVPDWRWQLERTDSPWYASLRLFRQEKKGEWKEVLEKIRKALELR